MTQTKSNIEKQIGAKITEIRLSKGLTQSQLAEKTDVSNETISRLERGVTIPSLKTLEKIAKSLEIPLIVFFDFRKNPSKNPLYEREIVKFIAFLEKRSLAEISLAYSILKVIFKKLKV